MTRSIGPYEVVAPLGVGGMGRVFEVSHPELPGRRLALKLLGRGATPEAQRRFEQEAELLARIKHPCVVGVHAAGSGPDGAWLVMDLVEGASLEAHRRLGSLAPRRAAELMADLAGAVGALHERGIIHRDLKPDNVMLEGDGRPVLIDFGIARSMSGARLTRAGVLMGTPSYLAPEQARSSEVDQRVDVWGLGAILFTLLAGRQPFEAPSLPELLTRIRLSEPRWPSIDDPGIPDELEGILRRCLAKEPDQRWPTARSLEEALRAFLARPARGRRGAAVPLLFVLLSVLGAALLASWIVRSDPARDDPGGADPLAPPSRAAEVSSSSQVLALPHGPASAIGVRFVAVDRALTWGTLPPGERGAAAVGSPSTLRVWATDPVRPVADHTLEGPIEQLAPLPRGELLLTIRRPDRGWRLARFDPRAGAPPRPVGVEGPGPGRITALAASADGKLAALAEHRVAADGAPQEAWVWMVDLATGRHLARLSVGDLAVHALLLHADGNLYTAGVLGGGRVSSWKPESWLEAAGPEVLVVGTSQNKLVRKLPQVPRALLQDGDDLWAGDEAGYVRRLDDIEDGPIGTRLGGPVTVLVRHGDGTFFALAAADDVRLAEVSAFTVDARLGSLRGWEHRLASLDLSPDGAWLAVGFADADRAELIPTGLLRAGGILRREALGAAR